MPTDEWTPNEVDTERSSPARVYDFLFGGAHNFAPDREMATQAARCGPRYGEGGMGQPRAG